MREKYTFPPWFFGNLTLKLKTVPLANVGLKRQVNSKNEKIIFVSMGFSSG
jgi:hypothetical protein